MDLGSVLEELELRVWCTKDGRCIPLRDLNDKHLDNIMAMLRRRFPGIEEAETALLYLIGPEPSGDGARDAWQQEADTVLDRVSWEAIAMRRQYAVLRAEKERRTNGRQGRMSTAEFKDAVRAMIRNKHDHGHEHHDHHDHEH